jgi:hypothetical protein
VICKIVLFHFVYRLNYKIIKLQSFGSLFLPPSSVKKWKRTETLSVGPPGLRLAQLGGPAYRVSVLFPFYLKTEAEYSFRNVVILLFYNLDDGQSPREQFCRLQIISSDFHSIFKVFKDIVLDTESHYRYKCNNVSRTGILSSTKYVT